MCAMKLLIFGASGKSGKVLVEQALARGHTVRAFVRDPAKLEVQHARLSLLTGDILDPATVAAAYSDDLDAVISVVGIYNSKPSSALSDGTLSVLKAAAAHGVQRFVAVSSLGVGDSKGQGNFVARNWAKYMLKEVLKDKERQESYIRASGLNWTVIRPPQLIDQDQVREIVAWEGPTPEGARLTWKTTRASVASFLLDMLEKETYVGVAVNISEAK